MTQSPDLRIVVPTLEPDARLVDRVVELTSVSRARAQVGGGFEMRGTGRRAGRWSIHPTICVTRRGRRDR